LPTTSIDGFFACTLLVSVVLIVTASFAGAMQANINSLQGVNDQNYLKTTAEQIVCNVGSPADWGSTGTAPDSFGLAKLGGQPYELDLDKICRLNNQCSTALTYEEAVHATRLYNIAFGITVTQMLSVNLEAQGNTTNGESTTYNFQVSTAANQNPVAANIQGYIVTGNQVSNVSAATSSSGVGNFNFTLPSSEAEPALLVVFAKADLDERLTAYQTYSFNQADLPVLSLNPLCYQLTLTANMPDVTVTNVYALSFKGQSQLSSAANGSYPIPHVLDKSPIVLVAAGYSQDGAFTDWVSYPCVPLRFGSNFANTAQNTFTYTVTINDVLYKLTVTLGELTDAAA
jgi:hypothetical protein